VKKQQLILDSKLVTENQFKVIAAYKYTYDSSNRSYEKFLNYIFSLVRKFSTANRDIQQDSSSNVNYTKYGYLSI